MELTNLIISDLVLKTPCPPKMGILSCENAVGSYSARPATSRKTKQSTSDRAV